MVALFAYGEGDGHAISGGRKRAGGIGSVGAGRIFETIEIENEGAGFVEAVIGKNGVEKTAGVIGGGGAGGVFQNEEKLLRSGLFEDGLEAIGFSLESKFSGAGDGLIVFCAGESIERDRFWR